MSDNKRQLGLATQIKNYRRSGEFGKALEISERALESDPADLEAYSSRWELIAEMYSEADAKKRIDPEIETLLRTHPETLEVLNTAYWGYRCLPGRAKDVPSNLLDKMLQFPRTKIYLIALLNLAEQSDEASQQWHYYQRAIDECTISDGPSTWYMEGYEKMLALAEQDRSLASDDYLDELIDGLLKAHLFYCQETQQELGWAYREAVKWRLKFNVRLDKALETLEHAEIRLGEEEEQKWLVENNKGSVEEAQKDISRLRAEVYLQQERWRKAHDGLLANAPDFLESLWARFSESSLNYFYMLGRSAVKTVYERFSKSDDVVVLGINDGEPPQKVREFLDQHQPPWPVLLDPQRQVLQTYQIRAFPCFILIDKGGNWQYSFNSSNLMKGQPLIWLIEALLSD